MKPLVILGSGLAGYSVAREWRKLDRDTPLLIITTDDGSFYSKPMLSNALSLKKTPAALANADAAAMASQLDATILTHRRVAAIAPSTREIVLHARAGGPLERFGYARLVLALGAEPRRAQLAGDGAGDVLCVNDLGDYRRFRDTLDGCRSVAILGAGLVGCEFANDLVASGYIVSVIDPAATPLARLLPEAAGQVLAQGLHESGICFHLGRSATAVRKREGGYVLAFADGGELEVDLVLSAIGLSPRVGLARAAGLEVNHGVCTDAWCRTSAPDIYALGDCAEMDGQFRPYVLPIMHAARALARTLAGDPQRVVFPVMPVSLKTPASPAVIAMPAQASGAWSVAFHPHDVRNSVRAICADPATGRTIGFALVGSAVSDKAPLLQEMSALPP